MEHFVLLLLNKIYQFRTITLDLSSNRSNNVKVIFKLVIKMKQLELYAVLWLIFRCTAHTLMCSADWYIVVCSLIETFALHCYFLWTNYTVTSKKTSVTSWKQGREESDSEMRGLTSVTSGFPRIRATWWCFKANLPLFFHCDAWCLSLILSIMWSLPGYSWHHRKLRCALTDVDITKMSRRVVDCCVHSTFYTLSVVQFVKWAQKAI